MMHAVGRVGDSWTFYDISCKDRAVLAWRKWIIGISLQQLDF
ncbi:hypothetical protein [Dehalobacter sp. MCB1]|nr:hypothetical protein [Dehalobacter sp. MCB1]